MYQGNLLFAGQCGRPLIYRDFRGKIYNISVLRLPAPSTDTPKRGDLPRSKVGGVKRKKNKEKKKGIPMKKKSNTHVTRGIPARATAIAASVKSHLPTEFILFSAESNFAQQNQYCLAYPEEYLP